MREGEKREDGREREGERDRLKKRDKMSRACSEICLSARVSGRLCEKERACEKVSKDAYKQDMMEKRDRDTALSLSISHTLSLSLSLVLFLLSTSHFLCESLSLSLFVVCKLTCLPIRFSSLNLSCMLCTALALWSSLCLQSFSISRARSLALLWIVICVHWIHTSTHNTHTHWHMYSTVLSSSGSHATNLGTLELSYKPLKSLATGFFQNVPCMTWVYSAFSIHVSCLLPLFSLCLCMHIYTAPTLVSFSHPSEKYTRYTVVSSWSL